MFCCFFGNLYQKDKTLCVNIYKQYINSLCKKLNEFGINVNTIPVLDVLRNNTSKILENRVFSKTKNCEGALQSYSRFA